MIQEFVELRKKYKTLVSFRTFKTLLLVSEAICKLTPIKYENDTKFQPSDVFVDYSHCSIAIEFAVTKNKHLNGMLQKQLISKRYENLKKKKVLKYKHKSLR